jgi:hypothetical protein
VGEDIPRTPYEEAVGFCYNRREELHPPFLRGLRITKVEPAYRGLEREA